jgi:hypothetical protein
MTETKAIRTFVRVYCVFSCEQLNTNIKLTHHKALIRSVMTYTFPTCNFTTDTCVLKLHYMQNEVLRTIGNLSEAHTDA